MKRKYCQDCGKGIIVFVTRKGKDGVSHYICKDCAPKYQGQGMVSYHKVLEDLANERGH